MPFMSSFLTKLIDIIEKILYYIRSKYIKFGDINGNKNL